MILNILNFAVCAVSLVVFIIIFTSILHDKRDIKENTLTISSSFLMFLVLLLIYFEQSLLQKGISIFLLSFITYFTSILSHLIIVSLICKLYNKKNLSTTSKKLFFIYCIFAGIYLGYNSLYGNYVIGHFRIGLINIVPTLFLLTTLFKYDKKFYTNVFFIQVIFLLSIYIAKSIIILINIDVITYQNLNLKDIIFSMFQNILIYSYFISYIFVKSLIHYNELNYHKEALEISLSKVRILSETDGLTKVYNYRKINELIDNYIDSYNHGNIPFSIVLIDIDKFKEINDNYGHIIGDKVLSYFTKGLTKCIRDNDNIGRIGGDEFIIILNDIIEKNSYKIISKIEKYFKNNKPIYIKSHITISYGLSSMKNNYSKEKLLNIADNNMYEHKNSK